MCYINVRYVMYSESEIAAEIPDVEDLLQDQMSRERTNVGDCWLNLSGLQVVKQKVSLLGKLH